jgi:ABC-type sugar transport system ATPase subunit
MADNNLLLKMSNICKSFGSVQVLSDVCFDLYPGEVHILAGENGAGKSTLIKILAGVHTDYKGRIELDNEAVRFSSVVDAASYGISVIHQELSLVAEMSVCENIFLGREKYRFCMLDKSGMQREAMLLLNDLGLELNVNKKVEEYPLSTQQMVEIAKAMAFESRIIVMDEPTSALNDVEVEKLFSLIKQLKSKGCGIIYISHKMEEIYRIGDRITVLRDGRYVATDDAESMPEQLLVKNMVGRELDKQFPRHQTEAGSIRLEVSKVTVPDQTGKPVPVVDGVSFSVRGGEIVGLAGLQGSGNSELVNGIFGSYGDTVSGEVKVDGEVMGRRSPGLSIKKGLALLTNDRKETGLVPTMNIIENTTLASLGKYSPMMWLRPGRQEASAMRHQKELNIKAATLKISVVNLSGGNQQKVVLAKWIETEPKVLLLDEPTRGVDVGAKHEIYELMNSWTAGGISIVLITSEMPELLAMSDRIIVMHRGKISAEFASGEATQEKILNAAMGGQN